MSAAAAADAAEPAKPKSKKMLFIIIGVVVLALVGAGAAFFLMKQNQAEAAEGDGSEEAYAAETAKKDPKTPPTFLPLDAMVVNLADEGGNRFVQMAITLQLTDAKVAEDMKVFMPSIRNSILMLISQRTAEEMLRIEGKEALIQDIIAEVSMVMDYDYERPNADAAEGVKSKRKKRPVARNPIEGVLFSSFIVQ